MKNRPFIIAILFLSFLISCSPATENVEQNAAPVDKQAIEKETHSLMDRVTIEEIL